MKKIFMILCAMLVVITGCSSKLSSYEEISFSELEKMFEKKEDFALFIGSAECSHCQSYKPKLETVIKVNQVKVYYIDISKLSNEEYDTLNKYVTFSGTPYTVFFEDGKLKENGDSKTVYTINGDRDIEYIEDVFRKNGYIK